MEIRTLQDGEVIQEPGFYQIPMARHHDQPCMTQEAREAIKDGVLPPVDQVSVTSGVLRKMELQTPADVWAFSKLNPNRWPEEDKTALRLGRAMAAYVEGGMDEVAKHFVVLPKDKSRKPTAAQIAAYEAGKATDAGTLSVEFWAKIEADPRDPLTDAEQTMIENMGKVLALDPAACAVMGGIPEITMAYQDPITGIWVLSRPDTVSFDGSVNDFKKINTQGRPFNHNVIDRRIEQHGYHQQMALAVEAFEMLTGETPSIASVVAQWDQAPHHVILREIGEEAINIGRFHNRRALDRFHECFTSGRWPGPGDDVGAFQPSEWWWKRATDDMNLAGVAP